MDNPALDRPKNKSVFNLTPAELENPQKYQALLEQYKVYSNTLDDSSTARRTFHTLFISINSLLFFGISLAIGNKGTLVSIDTHMLLFMNAVGVLISFAWYLIIYRYRARSGEILCILCEIEEKMPLRLFQTEYDRMRERFSPFTRDLLSVEIWIPWLFVVIHVSFVLGIYARVFTLGAQ